MNVRRFENLKLGRLVTMFVATLFAAALAMAGPQGRSVFVLTSTNNPSGPLKCSNWILQEHLH
jgi:hypothetical protein